MDHRRDGPSSRLIERREVVRSGPSTCRHAPSQRSLMPLLARSILTTIRESDPPLHVAVRVRKSRWNLVGHPRVLQAVDVAGIVQPEEQHADAVAIVVNNAWAVRHGVADIVRGREVAAQAEAHHRHRTVSYSRPSTWASSSSRPAKVLLVDGPSTMGKSQ